MQQPFHEEMLWLINRILEGFPQTEDEIVLRRKEVCGGEGKVEDEILRLALECLALVESRLRDFDLREAQGRTQALPEFEFHERPTLQMPKVPIAAREAEEAQRTEARPRWGEIERRLYEDIINLFELGDATGAMISLERLLMLSPSSEETDTFIRKNEQQLLKLYRDLFGSTERVLVPVSGKRPIKIPTSDAGLVMNVLRYVDGQRSIQKVLEKARLPELRGLMVVAHLARSGFIEVA